MAKPENLLIFAVPVVFLLKFNIRIMKAPLFYTLHQCDSVKIENTTMPYMTSLHSCLNRIVGDGYTDDFKPTVKGLQSKTTNKVYKPQEVKIVSFFRFEGNSNPEDNAIMYIIETVDGQKGTLVNSYKPENQYANLFMREVETSRNSLQ
jgi:hypothetical protein